MATGALRAGEAMAILHAVLRGAGLGGGDARGPAATSAATSSSKAPPVGATCRGRQCSAPLCWMSLPLGLHSVRASGRSTTAGRCHASARIVARTAGRTGAVAERRPGASEVCATGRSGGGSGAALAARGKPAGRSLPAFSFSMRAWRHRCAGPRLPRAPPATIPCALRLIAAVAMGPSAGPWPSPCAAVARRTAVSLLPLGESSPHSLAARPKGMGDLVNAAALPAGELSMPWARMARRDVA